MNFNTNPNRRSKFSYRRNEGDDFVSNGGVGITTMGRITNSSKYKSVLNL